ncbi:helix-turn-helix domain-containing protein [Altererythrobacter sp. CAU 1778]
MINRIRDIRKQKGLTLAEVAERCEPATTAQTIGRLETGMRSLSLSWMNRIAAALNVEAEMLVTNEGEDAIAVVARLTVNGPEALDTPRDAVLPTDLAAGGPLVVMTVEASAGEYRPGDQLWLRQHDPDEAGRMVNRDVLVPKKGGRFAFGRLIDRRGTMVGILPPVLGEKQVVVDSPPWIALAEMLVRKL